MNKINSASVMSKCNSYLLTVRDSARFGMKNTER